MQHARLIPVSGISSTKEAEQRATSAFLAVLTIVRDLSLELLTPLGASRAQRASVEAFTEVQYDQGKRRIRPDGLISVTYGKSEWSTLVEVKTGDDSLDADQINDYWDVAREHGIDHVLTISNEIAPNADTHPTDGLRVRSNSPVQVSHLSWTAILTSAVRIKQHAGVSDPEQAWILSELIRYLEHPASGALAFGDMGPAWVSIRDEARTGTLGKRSDGIDDVCARWDQLLRYAALRLGSEIGEDVTQVLSRRHRDPQQRIADLIDSVCNSGRLTGVLRVPNTAGDLEVTADLRAQHLTTHTEVDAPDDRGAVGRLSWLVRQLEDAPPDTVIETYPKNARSPTAATLEDLREDRNVGLDEDKREPFRFRVVWHAEMGKARKTGRKTPGFIDSVLDQIDGFYGQILQNLAAWQPPAPKMRRSASIPDEDDAEAANG